MKYNIKISPVKNSRISEVDFDNIPFGRIFSDHMFVADYRDGNWINPRIVPFGNFEIHPACLAIHYGQAIFEGMKASKSISGQPLLFRPELHAERINKSAERMCMPTLPENLFLEALHTLISLDRDWIPPQQGSALYVRPYMFADGEFIGVAPSNTYKFIIFTGPVGPYYPKPVRLVTEQKYVRAVPGGSGEAKAAGNYGAALLPVKLAKEKGFDEVIWLDGHEFKYIEEVGTMNLFFVLDGKVVTPKPQGSILKGITRKSFIEILKQKQIPVEERKVSIDEVVEAYKSGKLQEAFGAGTAAVVAHISEITHNNFTMKLPAMEDRYIGKMLKAEIDGLRAGLIPDKNGWVVPVIDVTESQVVEIS